MDLHEVCLPTPSRLGLRRSQLPIGQLDRRDVAALEAAEELEVLTNITGQLIVVKDLMSKPVELTVAG